MASGPRKSKSTDSLKEESRIIPLYSESAHIEREINDHILSIRKLIGKLRPTERQSYFNGLLAHFLHQELSAKATSPYPSVDADYSGLSSDDLALIRELSGHLHQLWLETGAE